MSETEGCRPVDVTLDDLIERVRDLPRPAVVGIDGRSGSGKSTLADQLVTGLAEAEPTLLRLEDLYPGWDGLSQAPTLAARWVLDPLSRGEPARYRRYDWARGQFAPEWIELGRPELLVVEGVGALARVLRPHHALSIWLDAPADYRRQRALDRDGDLFAPHWDRWALQEDNYLLADDPASSADLRISA